MYKRQDPDGPGGLQVVSDVYKYNLDGSLAETWKEVGPDTTPVNKVCLTYDALGRLTRKDDALGLLSAYKYNALGQVEVEFFAGGTQVAFEYDSLGRVVRKCLIGVDGVSAEAFGYDYQGNLVLHTNEFGDETTYKYDGLGRITEERQRDYSFKSDSLPNQLEERWTEYTYDANGNLTDKRLKNSSTQVLSLIHI